MKTFSTLILATLAVAAFVAESADAVQVHGHRGQPVMKKVNLAKHQRPAKLVASDLEADGDNVLSDPFAEGPISDTLAFDEEPPTKFTGSNSNSGSGADEDSSLDGSADGSNEDSSADGSSGDSSGDGSADDGSGVTDGGAANPPAAKRAAELTEVTEWALFDLESSIASDDGSGGSQDDDELSSSSGSNADADGSGSNDDSGSGETTPGGPIGNVQGFDGEGPQPPSGGWGDITGAGETKEARKAKLHHEQKAAVELAARASADSSAPFGLKGAKPVLLAGAAIGAAVGALAAVMGVMHLRRQQQRDEQSTLAAELPEPQTGREDFDATAANGEPAADELASSSVDLEEALTRESESEEEEDAEEGAFANGSTVV